MDQHFPGLCSEGLLLGKEINRRMGPIPSFPISPPMLTFNFTALGILILETIKETIQLLCLLQVSFLGKVK